MIRDWLLNHAEEVTRVAVWIACLLGAAVTYVVLAGLWVAFRPQDGYLAMIPLAVTLLHLATSKRPQGASGRPAGAHRMAA